MALHIKFTKKNLLKVIPSLIIKIKSVWFKEDKVSSDNNYLESSTSDAMLSDDINENKPILRDNPLYQSQSKRTITGWYSAINSGFNTPSQYASNGNLKQNDNSHFRSPSPEYNKIKLSAVSQMLMNLK